MQFSVTETSKSILCGHAAQDNRPIVGIQAGYGMYAMITLTSTTPYIFPLQGKRGQMLRAGVARNQLR